MNMYITTLSSLAKEIKVSIDLLVEQFSKAGINKNKGDLVTQREKEILLAYLNQKNGKFPNVLTFQRKTKSVLNVSDINGKNHSIKVEIRKNRVYLRNRIDREKQKNIDDQILKQKENNNPSILDIREEKKKPFQENRISNFSKEELQKKSSEIFSDLRERRSMFKSIMIDQSEKIKSSRTELENGEKQENQEIKKKQYESKLKKIDIRNEESKQRNPSTIIHSDFKNHDLNSDSSLIQRKRDRTNSPRTHQGIRKNHEKKKYIQPTILAPHKEELYLVKNSKVDILKQSFNKPKKTDKKNISIGEKITISELAEKMAIKSSKLIREMNKMGMIVTIDQIIDQETAQLVAEEIGFKVSLQTRKKMEHLITTDRDLENIEKEPRDPIVTVMGHVDHGKTSLLDCIRSTEIASNEIGGITQKIGVYRININNGTVVFLDTPGHSAFSSMRKRGTKITDIVVLVVAADDGVMPQTIESIHYAKEENVPIIIAINKIDKVEKEKINRIQKELACHDLLPEIWGGEHQFILVSAKTGEGIKNLLDAILLQSEILELKAKRKGEVTGTVIESSLDKNKGPLATILIREGTLHRGNIVLCGLEYGKIRAIRNDLGQSIDSVGPSIPAEILGLSGVPSAGDEIKVVKSEKKAREIALYRKEKHRENKLSSKKTLDLHQILSSNKQEKINVNLILKANLQGSVEVLLQEVNKLSNKKIKISIIRSGVGNITENDAILASTSRSILMGFNVHVEANARKLIKKKNLYFRNHSIIYDFLEEMKKSIIEISGYEYKKKTIGRAEIKNIFPSKKFGIIAGSIVIDGIINRANKARILRQNKIIYEGELSSLKRFKEDVKEVRRGMECGIGMKDHSDIRVGDIIEIFTMSRIPRDVFDAK